MELPSAGCGPPTTETTPQIPSFVPPPAVPGPSFPSIAGASPSFASTPPSSRLPDTGVLPLQSQVIAPGQVMTDEQMETLRRQISVYATICQQLVEMHKATMAQQNAISGSRYGQSSSFDSGFNPMGHKFASRQRWTPSQTQLQILEKLFQQGNGTPTKQRIKEISTELSQYGPISETNVYNWFQNRRARTKRKQQAGGPNNGESEMDTDVDSQEEKRIRTDKDLLNDSLTMSQYETNSQKWEHMDAAQKGFGVSHQQLNNCMPRDAVVVDVKADPMALSLQEDQGRRGTYDVNNEALRILQNLKSSNSAE